MQFVIIILPHVQIRRICSKDHLVGRGLDVIWRSVRTKLDLIGNFASAVAAIRIWPFRRVNNPTGQSRQIVPRFAGTASAVAVKNPTGQAVSTLGNPRARFRPSELQVVVSIRANVRSDFIHPFPAIVHVFSTRLPKDRNARAREGIFRRNSRQSSVL